MKNNIIIFYFKNDRIDREYIEDRLSEYQHLDLKNTKIYIFSTKNIKDIELTKEMENIKIFCPEDNHSFVSKKELYKRYAIQVREDNQSSIDELIILFGNKNSDKQVYNIVKREILKELNPIEDFEIVADRKLNLIKNSQNNLFQISIYFLLNPNNSVYNETELKKLEAEYEKKSAEQDLTQRTGMLIPMIGLIFEKLKQQSNDIYQNILTQKEVISQSFDKKIKIEKIKNKSFTENFLIDDIYDVENNNETGTVVNISCNYETLKKILSNNFYINSFKNERIKIRINDPETSINEQWKPDHFTSSVYFKFKASPSFPMYLTKPLKEEKNTFQLYEPQSVELHSMQYYFMSMIAYKEKSTNNYKSVTHHYDESYLDRFLEEKYKMEAAKKILDDCNNRGKNTNANTNTKFKI